MAPRYSAAEHGTGFNYTRAIAFDGDSSGKHDHLFLYTPTSGACCVAKCENRHLKPLHKTAKGGVGGFGFGFRMDRAIALDYDSSGKLDHLLLFRPGAGACFILKSEGNGRFKTIYRMPVSQKPTEHAGRGLGAYPLRMVWEKMFAFDYNHSGKLDHLCIYQRLQGVFNILAHEKGHWKVVHKGQPKKGLGGYAMGCEEDFAQAIDWNSTGRQDCILFCRFRPNYPGNLPAHTIVVAHQEAKFVVVWRSGNIAGLNPFAAGLRAFVFDYMSTGHMNHMGFWVAGHGLLWILQGGKHLALKYKTGTTPPGKSHAVNKGHGIAGCTNMPGRCLALDFESKGRNDHIFILGGKQFWVIAHGEDGAAARPAPHKQPHAAHAAHPPAHPPAHPHAAKPHPGAPHHPAPPAHHPHPHPHPAPAPAPVPHPTAAPHPVAAPVPMAPAPAAPEQAVWQPPVPGPMATGEPVPPQPTWEDAPQLMPWGGPPPPAEGEGEGAEGAENIGPEVPDSIEWDEYPDSQPEADELGDWAPDMSAFPKNEAGHPMDVLSPEELAEQPQEPPEMDLPVVDESDEAAAGII